MRLQDQAGRVLSIRNKSLKVQEHSHLYNDAGLVLIHYLATDKVAEEVKDKTILELGAGTGAVGLAASLLGAQSVLLTDLPHLVPCLQANIQANSLQHCVAAAALTWGGALPDLPAPDVILASDLLYSKDQIPLLFQTISQLSSPTTVTLLAYEHREPVVQATFDAIQDAGLRAQQAGPVHNCTREYQ
eukprot:jgi/Astpho2/269/Aster-x0910